MSKKLSGEEYRKRKKIKEETEHNILKSVKKVSAYFKPSTTGESESPSSSFTKDSEDARPLQSSVESTSEQSWTDLKMLTKKKAATMKKQGAKTGGGPISSSDSEEELMSPELPQLPREDSQGGFPASAGPSSCTAAGGSGLQVVHERILSIIGKTAVEGIRGIKELGIEQCMDSDSDETPDEPLPKRPNLKTDPKIPSKQVMERVASKKQLAAQWLENSKRKVEATEKVADALNNIANQIARIADSFELYNSQINESI